MGSDEGAQRRGTHLLRGVGRNHLQLGEAKMEEEPKVDKKGAYLTGKNH